MVLWLPEAYISYEVCWYCFLLKRLLKCFFSFYTYTNFGCSSVKWEYSGKPWGKLSRTILRIDMVHCFWVIFLGKNNYGLNLSNCNCYYSFNPRIVLILWQLSVFSTFFFCSVLFFFPHFLIVEIDMSKIYNLSLIKNLSAVINIMQIHILNFILISISFSNFIISS